MQSESTQVGLMRFESIGTQWQIDTPEPIPQTLRTALARRIDEFDRTYSRFRDDSLVARIATTPGRHEFPADAPPLFDLYRRLHSATAGRVSPLVGGSLDALGYDRTYSLRARAAAPAPTWDDAVAWDGTALTTVRPVSIDVGAAGKGYLVDIVGRMLVGAGIPQFTIDASGDILHSGAPIRVGLEHPLDPSKAIGVATVSGAICASAANRRAWGNGLHHVIDATTGLPTSAVIATWAIAATALAADGLATALFFADPAMLEQSFDFTWVLMREGGRVEFSPRFEGEIFR